MRGFRLKPGKHTSDRIFFGTPRISSLFFPSTRLTLPSTPGGRARSWWLTVKLAWLGIAGSCRRRCQNLVERAVTWQILEPGTSWLGNIRNISTRGSITTTELSLYTHKTVPFCPYCPSLAVHWPLAWPWSWPWLWSWFWPRYFWKYSDPNHLTNLYYNAKP